MKIPYDENNIPDVNSLRAKNYDDVSMDEVPEQISPDSPIKRIGVLTSGGDAPGMNAAVRAVVRAGINSGLEVYGIRRGYHGLLKGEIMELEPTDVSEKLQRGGTFLMTARSDTFMTAAGQIKGAKMAEIYGLDALIIIGGDGSYRGARCLARLGLPVIGIPGTIDNDIASTDYTIGYDTAMNTAVEAIDKLRDTASSHERCSVIEVMGRAAGYIAYNVGIATGAEAILIPEVPYDLKEHVLRTIIDGRNVGKKHFIIVVAEGAGDAAEIAKIVEETTQIESRATVLGYIQRGGSPTLKDRTSASLMGMRAVDCILAGRLNRLIAERNGKICDVDIEWGLEQTKTITRAEIESASRLSRSKPAV